tara:strand:- start:2160 stop:3710 length:1551 start_codon:yes stop_codon:yes gene_type:complete
MNNKRILWVDDEIDLLKSHIMFLESKGYNLISSSSGEDAIEICDNELIDLVLLDEMMTGMDGIETLKIIKEKHPNIPVIMVTKNEEEWLMEEAISEKISNYLIKPVNPSQVLIACKNILDNKKISDEKNTKDFLSYYNDLSNLDFLNLDYKEWLDVFKKLCEWMIKLETFESNNFSDLLYEQKDILNKQFIAFVQNNYVNWIKNEDRDPIMSPDIFDKTISPILSNNKKIIFIIIDCLRTDQWKGISPFFDKKFNINEDFHLSILPTATPFARNSIFSGMFPDEIKQQYPELWKKMFVEKKFNKYEDELFQLLLDKKGFSSKKQSYVKISDFNAGKKFFNKINDYKNVDVLNIVVNFVDILGHTRSESEILKELIPNEAAYRNSIYNWFQNSWLKDCISVFSDWNADIVLTSDHGNSIVDHPSVVKADNTASTGVRYKYGRNLNVKDKNILKIENPEDYKLPMFDVNTQYLISTGDNFFVYSNEYHKYINMYKGTFQHGGISMDEMLVPLIHLTKI